MENNNSFVAYEYKNITVKRDSVAIYTDCLSNFGWTLIDELEYGYHQAPTNVTHIYTPVVPPVSPGRTDDLETVALKFNRNRNISHKLEINRLERKCEDALSSINGIERKSNAYTMGISLGTGIVGTAILAFAVYNFVSSNIAIGVFLAVLGFAGWGIGFFANRKASKKQSVQTDPMIQEQLEIAYGACEQAHALLAS